ncbi:MAG: hypothetical protein RIN56_18845 [Sporomusaceae bacterium]|nr:hypothetical protein [Sporomusaceae bacterium]
MTSEELVLIAAIDAIRQPPIGGCLIAKFATVISDSLLHVITLSIREIIGLSTSGDAFFTFET